MHRSGRPARPAVSRTPDNFCAAVAAPTRQIRALGLDAEPANSVKPHLWPRICTAAEFASLQAQDEQSALATATLIFSAKEAFYKCQHTLTRDWLGFADLSIVIDADHFTVHATRSLPIAAQIPGPWRGTIPVRSGPGDHRRVHHLMPIGPPMVPGEPFIPNRSTTASFQPILALCCGSLTFGQA